MCLFCNFLTPLQNKINLSIAYSLIFGIKKVQVSQTSARAVFVLRDTFIYPQRIKSYFCYRETKSRTELLLALTLQTHTTRKKHSVIFCAHMLASSSTAHLLSSFKILRTAQRQHAENFGKKKSTFHPLVCDDFMRLVSSHH